MGANDFENSFCLEKNAKEKLLKILTQGCFFY